MKIQAGDRVLQLVLSSWLSEMDLCFFYPADVNLAMKAVGFYTHP